MEMESCVPPGFRFHPTEEELVGYYLRRKVNSLTIDLEVIVDLDLYRMEPWDIQDRCRLGYEERNEWYFFSHKDKKYPTGTRTNRATATGFWKATGRDKAVLSKNRMIGMRKTLVFYHGRAPNGRKTDWIMHEYRLQTSEHAPPQEEGWVVCRAFKKPIPNYKQGFEAWNQGFNLNRDNGDFRLPSYSDTVLFGPNHMVYSEDQDPMSTHQTNLEKQLVDLPQLHSPTLSTAKGDSDQHRIGIIDKDCDGERSSTQGSGQYVDWKIFDDLLGTQLAEPSSSSSFDHSNLPLLSQDYELSAQNHGTHLFTYIPPDL